MIVADLRQKLGKWDLITTDLRTKLALRVEDTKRQRTEVFIV
jgi:hypothetical protein